MPLGQPVLSRRGRQHLLLRFVQVVAHVRSTYERHVVVSGTSLLPPTLLAEAARRLMSAREVRLFDDQLLVKEPGSVAPTPWHQDLPYWLLRGDRICGLWCPLDPVDLDSGAVESRVRHQTLQVVASYRSEPLGCHDSKDI